MSSSWSLTSHLIVQAGEKGKGIPRALDIEIRRLLPKLRSRDLSANPGSLMLGHHRRPDIVLRVAVFACTRGWAGIDGLCLDFRLDICI